MMVTLAIFFLIWDKLFEIIDDFHSNIFIQSFAINDMISSMHERVSSATL